MRFDQWLLKHLDKPHGLGFIAYDFKIAPYNPLFKYRYCELFVKCYHYARYTHSQEPSKTLFKDWLMSRISCVGKDGNLARDVTDCFIDVEEKFKYCNRYVKYFGTAVRRYAGEGALDDLKIPTNLNLSIEGVRRVSPHLMAHPCFHGFADFMSLDDTFSL